MAGPLDRVTVIDLTSVVAGPLPTQRFAPGLSAVHEPLNAGKRSSGVDLAQAEGPRVTYIKQVDRLKCCDRVCPRSSGLLNCFAAICILQVE